VSNHPPQAKHHWCLAQFAAAPPPAHAHLNMPNVALERIDGLGARPSRAGTKLNDRLCAPGSRCVKASESRRAGQARSLHVQPRSRAACSARGGERRRGAIDTRWRKRTEARPGSRIAGLQQRPAKSPRTTLGGRGRVRGRVGSQVDVKANSAAKGDRKARRNHQPKNRRCPSPECHPRRRRTSSSLHPPSAAITSSGSGPAKRRRNSAMPAAAGIERSRGFRDI